VAFNQPLAGLVEPSSAPSWTTATDAERRAFYTEAGARAVKRLRAQLRRAVGRDGARMAPRKQPRADGANGPVMTPHRAMSRAGRLLDARVSASGVTLYWHGGVGAVRGATSFGTILGYHAAGEVPGAPVRDVRLCDAEIQALQTEMTAWWTARHPEKPTKPAKPGPSRVVVLPPGAKPVRPSRKIQVYTEPPAPPRPRLFAPAKAAAAKPKTTTKTKAKPVKPEKTPAPLPTPQPPLPDIRAKLAAYTEGDAKLKALQDAGTRHRELVDLRDRRQQALKAIEERMKDLRDPAARESAQADLEATRLLFRESYFAVESAERKHRAIAMQVLRTESPVRFLDPLESLGQLPEGARGAAERAVAYLGNALAAKPGAAYVSVAWKQLPARSGGRAYYDGGTVRLDPDDAPRTAVHELGHALEHKVPGWNDAAQAFLKHRVGDEPLRPLADLDPAYGPDERGRDDDFARAFGTSARYVGKDYGSEASEITAMGVEKLFHDPLNFALDDPEYAKFIMGMLDGSLR
jgi:hypothetical protein